MERAAEIMENARAGLEAKYLRLRDTDEPLGTVTMSVGVAELDRRNFDNSIRMADARLYRAKAEGRNKVAKAAG